MSGKKSSIIYHDLLSVVDEMPDEMAGKFIKSLLALMQNKEIDTPDFSLKIALHPFISQFKRDNEKYESICERNRVNGLKGGRPRNPNNPDGLLETQNNPNNHDTDNDTGNDTDNDKEELLEPDKPSVSVCPHKVIIGLYHDNLPELKKVRAWNDQCQKTLRARWNENKDYQDVVWWDNFFKDIKTMPFLMGKVKEFQADLMWMIGPKNFAKILNGKYVNNSQEPEDDYVWGQGAQQ